MPGSDTITFQVDEDWLNSIKIKVTESVSAQVYAAAMADPEKSGITTDNDEMNASIESMKGLVKRAKDINRQNHSDIRVMVDRPGSYTVKFAGQVYEEKISIKEAECAIDKIEAYLSHDNLVKVRIFKSGKSDIQTAMDLEAFINSRVRKVLSLSDDGAKYTLVYIARGEDDGNAERAEKD
ncbi:MAG: hypothetical protein LUE86_02245 [Clostridiales bacterium]|nr:hypothetical protein [Clostridiales bacterium]